MNATVTIARRELSEKRFVFVAAAAFLVLALMLPFMPGIRTGERAGALVLGSLILAAALTAGLAAILGATIVGKELSDGRLSFYFSKPVPATSIWWGKLAASIALMVACFAIVATPAFLVGSMTPVRRWANTPEDMFTMSLLVIAAASALFLVSHVVGTFVRSRSVWFLFDFVALSVCAIAAWVLGRQLWLGLAHHLLRVLTVALAVFVAVAIIAAGAWQIARGRTDRQRSHIELSRFLWTTIGCAMLLLTAAVLWITAAPIAGLGNMRFEQASSGPWTIIAGTAKYRDDYHASFLYNISDGRTVRIPPLTWSRPRFSGNGKVAAWLGDAGMYVADLNAPKPEPVLTQIGPASLTALSDDGSRAAVMDWHTTMTIVDLRTQTSLGSALLPPLSMLEARFVTPDLVRIYGNGAVLEFDVRRKTVERTGSVPEGFVVNRDATRVLVPHKDGPYDIRDGGTGALIAEITPHPAAAAFLRNGHVVAVENRGATSVLRVMTRDGRSIREIALPEAGRPWFAMPESSDGVITVIFARHSVVVDVNRGVLREDERMLCPTSTTAPGLVCYSRTGLMVWNPTTGQKRPIG